MSAAYYELVELLGEGGMGRVWRAFHEPTHAEVAIKTLRAGADALRKRLLLDEATAAARVRDPHVARVIDVGRDAGGAPFLVMELVPGHDLERVFVEWPGWPTVTRALAEVLEGLRAAHAVGVVHRDLKPPNVLVDVRDQGIRLVDFGIAAVVDPLDTGDERPIAGTPEFMPPEQITGEGPVGPFTDLYAFGVMLAHVVRGESPFSHHDDLAVLLDEKLRYVPGRDRRERPGLSVPEPLQALVDRLLDPRPRHRERFAERVRQQLEALAPHVVEVERASSPMFTRIARTSVDPSFEATAMATPGLGPAPAPLATVPDLVSERRLPAPADPAAAFAVFAGRDAPFAGRRAEHAELLAAIDGVCRDGGVRLLAYVGEPGIGKSRLARLGLEEVERRGVMEGAATGFDARGTDVSGGLFRLVSRWLGAPRDPRAAWRWVDDRSFDVDRVHRWLTATSDESGERPPTTEVVDIAYAVIRALSRRAPVYLWLDDLAWARDGAIELVARLIERQEARVLVVATLRAGTLQHEAAKRRLEPLLAAPQATVRTLAPLDREERRALVSAIAPLAPAIVTEIADDFDGSPMLLVEVVRSLVTSDRLESTPLGLAPRGGVRLEDLLGQRALSGVIASRVEALLAGFESGADLAEGVLVRAALLGAFFEDATLRASVAGQRPLLAAVDEVLDRALLHGILRSEGGSLFSFDHQLVQEALLVRLERSPERVRVYFDVANGLQSRHGKDRSDVAAAVAGLLRRAGAKDRAWDRMLHAIETAAWSGDRGSADTLLGTARGWLVEDLEPAASRGQAMLAYAEARAHYYRLAYADARTSLARALSIARLVGDAHLALSCEAFTADILFYQDEFAHAERIANACIARASEDDPDLALVGAACAHRLADLAVLRGDLDGAIDAWRRCVRFRAAASQGWRARIAKMNLAESLMVRGHLDEAGSLAFEVRREAESARDDEGIGACVELEAHLAYLRGDAEGARAAFRERQHMIEAKGDAWRATSMHAFLALLAVDLDPPDLAHLETIRFVEAYARVPHDEAFTIEVMRLLEKKLVERGLTDLADRVADAVSTRDLRIRRGFAP